MKKTLRFLSFLFFINGLSAQTVPSLDESALLQKTDFGKKAGWAKLSLDAQFNETTGASVYTYYEFVSAKGNYNSTHGKKVSFPHDATRVNYEKTNTLGTSTLLNGMLDFYGKNGKRSYRYIFKNGFLVKLFDFVWGSDKHNGRLKVAFVFFPSNDRVELICNSFDKEGKCSLYTHEIDNGQTYVFLPGLIPVTLDELNIANVWRPVEADAFRYDMFIDPTGHDGKSAATIRSIDKTIEGSGGLIQVCEAKPYHGKRIRIRGAMKTENVTGWAGFWTRIDQANLPGTVQSPLTLFIDNMRNRSVKGTTAWTNYEIVADVPASAAMIAFGAMLHGTGQLWFDDITIEIVDSSVPTTGSSYPGDNSLQAVPAIGF